MLGRQCWALQRCPKVLQLRGAVQCNVPTTRRVCCGVWAGRRRVALSRAVFGPEQDEQAGSHRKMPIARCACEHSSQYSSPAPKGTFAFMHTHVLCCIFHTALLRFTQQVYAALNLPEIFLPPVKVSAQIVVSCSASTNQSRDSSHAIFSPPAGGRSRGRGGVRVGETRRMVLLRADSITCARLLCASS